MIRFLDDNVIDKIAAGEIVERPVSVVRELVDNAIDAQAEDILIELEDGGTSIIRVSDNGQGMSTEDLKLSVKRHATSKIIKAEDLEKISTLGFRGEALPSIASISKFKIKTRRAIDETGTELTSDGGKEFHVTSVNSNPGTLVEIRSLFFNTPARRKFLKKPKTEELKIKQWLLQYAIAHPKVRFRLLANAKEIVNLPATKDSLKRAESLIEGGYESITQEFGRNLSVQVCAGHPGHARLATPTPVLLVNGRVVQDRMLARAVRDGYQSMLKPQESPVAIVCLKIDSQLLDVNVHPQKSEVRFKNSQEIFKAVRSSVTMALAGLTRPLSTFGSTKAQISVTKKTTPTLHASFQSLNLIPEESLSSDTSKSLVVEEDLAEYSQKTRETKYNNFRYLGQIMDCFLVFEHQAKMIVVDMHAAHERINYNKIRTKFLEGSLPSQHLLVALTLDLTEQELDNLESNINIFENFGFEFGTINDRQVVVKAAPTMLSGGNILATIKESCAFDEAAAATGVLNSRIDQIAASIACHASVRSGKKLNESEVYALLAKMETEEFSAACPHGRPVSIEYSRSDIEKWFGRDT
ncbi:MAG: DNA mismatch repair endonuclease MutL [Bdellovibrionota bacterium]